jgi:hypothetical protein
MMGTGGLGMGAGGKGIGGAGIGSGSSGNGCSCQVGGPPATIPVSVIAALLALVAFRRRR